MRALVLDFDGVISDSARESFAVAWNTFCRLSPGSALESRLRDDVYPAFLDMMPLGNRAEDYGVVLTAIADDRPLADQAAYDRLKASLARDWLERFHAEYYEVRRSMWEADLTGWLRLMRPYESFLAMLRRREGQVAYAIATSKDRRSVELLLDSYDARGLFPPERVLDKETGPDKAAHLTRIGDTLALPPEELTFVDDKVNHLDTVAPLGVRVALAGWGYNGRRERELARERGYPVLTLETVEAMLFGGGSTSR